MSNINDDIFALYTALRTLARTKYTPDELERWSEQVNLCHDDLGRDAQRARRFVTELTKITFLPERRERNEAVPADSEHPQKFVN